MLRRASTTGGAPGLPPFERVVDDHGPAVLRFCVAQVGPGAGDDCFQETMLSAMRAYGEVREARAIRSWLFSIAARKAIDAHRARGRAAVPVADPEPPGAASAEGPGPADEKLWTLVRELPEKQRQAVTLRYVGDLSHRDIARAMETSEDAARRSLHEGLKRLRSQLEDDRRPHTTTPGAVQSP